MSSEGKRSPFQQAAADALHWKGRYEQAASEVERLTSFAEWAMDTRDSEGTPASYEDIHDRAHAALHPDKAA